MANFWKIVDSVIAKADIILMVVDARMVEDTRNAEIERKVAASGKQLITVINKADLVPTKYLDVYKKKLAPCVFVSAKKFYGMTLLRHKILELSKGEAVLVGVVGYPNTGKSSIINSLKGKAAAGVSPISGYTKGKQDVKVDSKIMVIDTPGVLSEDDESGQAKFVLQSSTNINKDPELVVYELIKAHKVEVMGYYGIHEFKNTEEDVLEAIAIKLNKVAKGGVPDIETTARMILQDWQKGKIQV
jgi:ribosome biogenesis GTPase A